MVGSLRRSLAQLFDDEVHQQAVGPLAVHELGAAQDSDRPEPYGRVGLDRSIVRRVRVDREAVVAALVGEPANHRAQRVPTETLALEALGEADVEADRAILRLGLLDEAEPARELAIR